MDKTSQAAERSAKAEARELLKAAAASRHVEYRGVQLSDAETAAVPSQLIPAVRKLAKRYAETRRKALDELEIELQKDPNNIEGVFTVWPKLFCHLCLEQDSRVRLATMRVHQIIVRGVGRELGPVLRDIIGHWMLCCWDNTRAVSVQAFAAFDAAFPPAKRRQALIFASETLLEFYAQNLIDSAPETFADARYFDSQAMETKYKAVLASSIRGLRMLLDTLASGDEPPESHFPEDGRSYEILRSILEDDTFGDLFDEKESGVMTAMFETSRLLFSKYQSIVPNSFMRRCADSCFEHVELELEDEYWQTLTLIAQRMCFSMVEPDNVGVLTDSGMQATLNCFEKKRPWTTCSRSLNEHYCKAKMSDLASAWWPSATHPSW